MRCPDCDGALHPHTDLRMKCRRCGSLVATDRSAAALVLAAFPGSRATTNVVVFDGPR